MPPIFHPKYRPDIDGLRALAVLPVVIFHAFPEYLQGGYIGVDVFFVISGYLISTIIFSKIDQGSFSFFDFYMRRIRRIFPTLLTVLISCLFAGYFLLFPDEYKQLGKHISGSSLFISNFILLSESGYFDTSSISKPLLHLWSLAIEEQFYIIWPLLLLLSWKRKINLFIVTSSLILLSYYLNIRNIDINQSQTFYSPVSRFWEILAGSLLAWLTLYKKTFFYKLKYKVNHFIWKKNNTDSYPYDLISHTTSIIGLSLLSYGYLTFTENLAFPGAYALIPVSGALLLILSGPDAFINKYILSSRFFIWIGLISFPLYLWHWPLLSFAYIMESGTPVASVRGMLVIAAIILSILSYQCIEKNLRFGGNLTGKTVILFIAMVLTGIAGFAIYKENGFDGRLQKSQSEINDDQKVATRVAESQKRCAAIFPDWSKFTDNLCAMQKPSGENNIALIGDSHANHLFIGMSEIKGQGGIVVFPASCAAPFIDVSSSLKDSSALFARKYAYKLIDSAYNYVIKDKNIHEVILSHYPSCSYNDAIDLQNPSIKDSSVVIENGMRRSLTKLVSAGKKVILIKDSPELPFIPQACIVRPLRFNQDGGKCSFDKNILLNNVARNTYNKIIDKVIKDYPGVSSVDLSKLFCDEEKCYLSKNGHVLYRDITHLNKYGSRYVAPLIAAQ